MKQNRQALLNDTAEALCFGFLQKRFDTVFDTVFFNIDINFKGILFQITFSTYDIRVLSSGMCDYSGSLQKEAGDK